MPVNHGYISVASEITFEISSLSIYKRCDALKQVISTICRIFQFPDFKCRTISFYWSWKCYAFLFETVVIFFLAKLKFLQFRTKSEMEKMSEWRNQVCAKLQTINLILCIWRAVMKMMMMGGGGGEWMEGYIWLNWKCCVQVNLLDKWSTLCEMYWVLGIEIVKMS